MKTTRQRTTFCRVSVANSNKQRTTTGQAEHLQEAESLLSLTHLKEDGKMDQCSK